MKINEVWEELREKSHANIQSEKGILKRQIRSIKTEGHFGDIKENEDFRHFNYRSSDKVYKEFMLFALKKLPHFSATAFNFIFIFTDAVLCPQSPEFFPGSRTVFRYNRKFFLPH